MSNAKNCQSNAQHSQSSNRSSSSSSSSSRRSQQSCNCNSHSHSNSSSINSYTLIMALAALLPLLPLTHARYVNYQLSLPSDEDSTITRDRSQPAWPANPFHGLVQSYGESSYDRDVSSSRSSDSSSSDSSDSSSSSSSSSSSGSSSDSSSSNSNSISDSISDSSSSSSSSSSDSDSGSYNSDYVESQGNYEQLVKAAKRHSRRALRRQRNRHRRSNLNLFENTDSTVREWENPCNGSYEPDSESPIAEPDNNSHLSENKAKQLQNLKDLRRITYLELLGKQLTKNLEQKNSSAYWTDNYAFLPNMTRPTKVTQLKTWYRHMQTFVGSFAHLGKADYKFRKANQLYLPAKTEDLHMLLISARVILCKIETTINSSYPNSHGAKLSHVSRETMNQRLNFHTPADGSEEVNMRDLKLTRQLYYQYLDIMRKTLNISIHRKEKILMREQQQQQQGSSPTSTGAKSLHSSSMEGSASAAAAFDSTGQSASCRNSAEC